MRCKNAMYKIDVLSWTGCDRLHSTGANYDFQQR
jgi:hypothetical protein